MIQSMTGFGKSSLVHGDKKITVELKSLNSKQLDASVKMPSKYHSMELDIRATLAQLLHRGKVDVWITVEENAQTTTAQINIEALKAYKAQIEHLSQELDIDEPADWYATLLRLPEALKSDTGDTEASEEECALVDQVLCEAIDALNEFRIQEGNRLDIFFRERIDAIEALLARVTPFEQARVERIRERIEEGLAKLSEVEVDRNRFEQELIFYIEKLDITEEKVRLQNHLRYFIETLNDGECQGKKLGFIAQEMGREINTLGSKANQADIQKLVVMMKDNLEQIKEQVLNVL